MYDHVITNFLGWVDYHISLAMGLRARVELCYYFLSTLCEERGGRQNRPRLYADVVGSPREDSHIKVKGMREANVGVSQA